MEHNLILTLVDVLVIEQFFSKILNNVSLKVLCKEDASFWDPKKWDSKKWDSKESIQKINK
jgi:hypothetical protein